MPTDVKQLVTSGSAAGWTRWLVFAGAVLVTKSVVKTVSGLVATGADFNEAQRGAIRELFRM
jgi:hypothetical protein